MKAISYSDAAELKRLERVIAKGLRSFAEAGFALRQIRDSQLYRASHGSFEKYCEEKWGFGNRHANRLIQAGEVIENLESSTGTNWSRLPATESQARELAKASPAAQAEIWQEVTEATEKPTAADVRAAVERRVVQGEIVGEVYEDVPDDDDGDDDMDAPPTTLLEWGDRYLPVIRERLSELRQISDRSIDPAELAAVIHECLELQNLCADYRFRMERAVGRLLSDDKSQSGAEGGK